MKKYIKIKVEAATHERFNELRKRKNEGGKIASELGKMADKYMEKEIKNGSL